MTYIYNISRVLLQQQIAKFGHYVHGRVLDAGSGSYSRYKHLFSSDVVTRLDIVEGLNVDIVGSVEKMPFLDKEFDSILSTQVLEHVEYPEKAVAEMYRVLKVGGCVLVTVPQWNELHEEPYDFWRYTRFGMESLFKRNGFSVVEYAQIGGFFSNRAKMGMRYLIDRFHLYDCSFSRIVSAFFHLWSLLAMWLDKHDTSVANRKHTIGWVFVFKKEK